jgi:hypothetical protein
MLSKGGSYSLQHSVMGADNRLDCKGKTVPIQAWKAQKALGC